MGSTLRPREIQTRIRAGESAEDVATAAGTTVDSIMPFAAPVLAERAHIADLAQAASIRRRSEGGSAVRTLGESAEQQLAAFRVSINDVSWDAWKRGDGRWTVVAEYSDPTDALTDRRAEFTYDQPGRFVIAENDEARLLTGEASLGMPTPGETAAGPDRWLSSVPDELPLGDDVIGMVSEGPAEAVTDVEATIDVDLRPAGSAPAPAEPEEPEATPPAKPRSKGRSAVPSWDEIMFGGGKPE